MSHTLHAFDLLAAPVKDKLPGVCAVFGDDPFLKRLVLKELRRRVVGEDADVPVASYDCQERQPDYVVRSLPEATRHILTAGKPEGRPADRRRVTTGGIKGSNAR